jgi:predicted  nucleic acid-binding Zn-ribbon protein
VDNIDYIKVIEECETRPNSELLKVLGMLEAEFEDTKKLIVQLTEHLDKVEDSYNKINEEIKKRTGK